MELRASGLSVNVHMEPSLKAARHKDGRRNANAPTVPVGLLDVHGGPHSLPP